MAKSKQSGYFDGFSIRYLLLHPAVWFVAATGLVVVGANQFWERYSHRIVDPESYAISNVNFDIDPVPPACFRTTLENEFRNGLQSDGSLLSPDLVPKTAEFAKSIPWVRQVRHIKKQSNGLSIELEYRTPVAMMETLGQKSIAVDGEGVLFDMALLSDSETAQLNNDLLRVSMFQNKPGAFSAWQSSPDIRIRHAAGLCEFLQPYFLELKLYRVVSLDPPLSATDERPQFEIWTRNGTRIGWGSSPGSESDQEARALKKIQLVRQVAEEIGGLEAFSNREIQTINVVNGSVRYVEKIRNAELDRLHSLSR